MANVKPASAKATTNPPSASTLIKESGGIFVITATRIRAGWTLHRYQDISAPGNSDPVWDHNTMQNGRYTIYGHCVSGSEIGIEQLSGSSNPGTFKFIRESGSGAGTTQTVTMMVIDLHYDWEYSGVIMPLVIQGIVTSTAKASVEATS
jgi:hypothetical protein